MSFVDYLVIAMIMALLLVIGAAYSRKAGSSTDEFILAGRKMPWWLAGLSIAATGLNASTMLQDSRKVRQDGLGGLWYTWTMTIGGVLNAVFFYRLWRRARFTTQMEFYTARYSGWQAVFARMYDTLIYGGFLAVIWAAVGLVGMKKILHVLLDFPDTTVLLGLSVPTEWLIVGGLVAVTMCYAAASGVHGVVWTDFVEFLIAMLSSVILLSILWNKIGWMPGLRDNIQSLGPDTSAKLTSMLPPVGLVMAYYMFIGPFVSLGGYSPAVQRFLCVKNEKEVLYTALCSMVTNLVVKSWPFCLIGLCGIFLVSDQELLNNFLPLTTPEGTLVPDYEKVIPILAERYLPVGFLGMMMAGFLCAFLSSFDTNIHNSTSVFINDLYRSYLRPGKGDKHYVSAARFYMVGIAILTTIIGIAVTDILRLSMFSIALVISSGSVKLMRFIWWRTNGKAEVAAQITSLITCSVLLTPLGDSLLAGAMDMAQVEGNDGFFVVRQLMLMSFSTLVAFITILVTKPEPMDKLIAFYKRVRPFGWWRPVVEAANIPQEERSDPIGIQLILSLGMIFLIFSFIFLSYSFALAQWKMAGLCLLVSFVSLFVTSHAIKRIYPKPLAEG